MKTFLVTMVLSLPLSVSAQGPMNDTREAPSPLPAFNQPTQQAVKEPPGSGFEGKVIYPDIRYYGVDQPFGEYLLGEVIFSGGGTLVTRQIDGISHILAGIVEVRPESEIDQRARTDAIPMLTGAITKTVQQAIEKIGLGRVTRNGVNTVVRFTQNISIEVEVGNHKRRYSVLINLMLFPKGQDGKERVPEVAMGLVGSDESVSDSFQRVHVRAGGFFGFGRSFDGNRNMRKFEETMERKAVVAVLPNLRVKKLTGQYYRPPSHLNLVDPETIKNFSGYQEFSIALSAEDARRLSPNQPVQVIERRTDGHPRGVSGNAYMVGKPVYYGREAAVTFRYEVREEGRKLNSTSAYLIELPK